MQPYKFQVFNGSHPDPSGITPVVNTGWHKPRGGFWTSTLNLQTGSDWVHWQHCEQWYASHLEDLYLVVVQGHPRVYTIDSVQDMDGLFAKYPLDQYGCGIPGIDYTRVARDYDAVHITARGQEVTRHTFPRNLNGWDCESTLWFRWCFRIPVLKLKSNREEFKP